MNTASISFSHRRLLYWQVLVGGRLREDDALMRVVVPSIASVVDPDRPWHFLRYFDERGPHLRVRVHADGLDPEGINALDELLASALERHLMSFLEAPEALAPEPLIPMPPHHEFGGRGVGVHAACYEREIAKYGNAAGVRIAEDVWDVSSRVILGLLPQVRHDQVQRVALATALSAAAVNLFARRRKIDPRVFWTRYGLYWSGGRNRRSRSWLQSLANDEQVFSLVEIADSQNPEALELAEAVVVGCLHGEEAGGIPAETLLSHHLHLTNNRLGVIPSEESLVAVTALHLRRRMSTAQQIGEL